jgi:hypothetical protein
MIIIAGTLHVAPSDRDRYLAEVADVARLARLAPGCLDFAQTADPLDPTRINGSEPREAPRWSFHRCGSPTCASTGSPASRSPDS